jgi:hypothetical protein
MNYPLTLSFGSVIPSPPLSVHDRQRTHVLTIVPKRFTFCPSLTAFGDPARQQLVYTFTADRLFHFGVCYTITTADNTVIGRVCRAPLPSLWRAHYHVTRPMHAGLTITEANPEDKLLKGCMRLSPIVHNFTERVPHPTYLVRRADGRAIMRLDKQSDQLEGAFKIEKSGTQAEEEQLALLSLLTIAFVERWRG